MSYRLTDTDRTAIQKLLDQLGEGTETLVRTIEQLSLVAKGDDAHPLVTVGFVVSRLFVVQARIEHARDGLGGLLDRVNEALTAPAARDCCAWHRTGGAVDTMCTDVVHLAPPEAAR